ncbi:CapA family protein [Haloarcula halophila]|uniref:CapA family protein n=1 Tax=Haloarcula TaxID=2237 RepID=UPI0023E3A52A|nr:CapA family protein [Halomicroarcula sp. DFY41]
MTDSGRSRRALLRTVGTVAGTALAGCGTIADVFPASDPPDTGPQSSATAVRGRVVDTGGTPVVDADVTALGTGGTNLATARTDDGGRFSLSVRRPVWVRVRKDGYNERVRACRPGPTHRIVVTEATGTATLTFGGDTMFARRFYTDPTDQLNPRARIDPGDRRGDHDAILDPIEPALSAADLTSVNLETPLTTRGLRHPEKTYSFASHPVAADALAAAGVDYAALGNNHVLDALGPGLRDTTAALAGAGVGYSGAGTSAAAAWEPHVQGAGDLTVAFLSCTTITGDFYAIDLAANGPTDRPVTVTIDGESRTVPAGVGAARATTDRLDRAVRRADETADVVVVQIHGGEPYQRTPTPDVRRLTATAARSGADLVVNHHPHVTGGIERVEGALVAWSLGNLVFDQRIWPTFPTYLLTVTVSAEGAERATVDPVLIDGFVPHGIVGKPNRTVTWNTLATSSEEATATRSGVTFGAGSRPERAVSKQFPERGAIYAREVGWVAGVTEGQIRLGRDLLPTGRFESTDIDGEGYDGSLWRYGRTYPTVRREYGTDGSGGVRLRRVDGNRSRAVLSNTRRVPIDGPLTVTTNYRASETGTTLELTWFADTDGSAIGRRQWSLPPTGDRWQRFVRDASPPTGATHVNVLHTLAPPANGRRRAEIDDVRLVQWGDQGTTADRRADHIRVRDPATVEFGLPAFAERVQWPRLL